jgi:hypothetical protein
MYQPPRYRYLSLAYLQAIVLILSSLDVDRSCFPSRDVHKLERKSCTAFAMILLAAALHFERVAKLEISGLHH